VSGSIEYNPWARARDVILDYLRDFDAISVLIDTELANIIILLDIQSWTEMLMY